MLPVKLQVVVLTEYISAVAEHVSVLGSDPPTTKILAEEISVAVCCQRASLAGLVVLQ